MIPVLCVMLLQICNISLFFYSSVSMAFIIFNYYVFLFKGTQEDSIDEIFFFDGHHGVVTDT